MYIYVLNLVIGGDADQITLTIGCGIHNDLVDFTQNTCIREVIKELHRMWECRHSEKPILIGAHYVMSPPRTCTCTYSNMLVTTEQKAIMPYTYIAYEPVNKLTPSPGHHN
jgi:hypothetical protein